MAEQTIKPTEQLTSHIPPTVHDYSFHTLVYKGKALKISDYVYGCTTTTAQLYSIWHLSDEIYVLLSCNNTMDRQTCTMINS